MKLKIGLAMALWLAVMTVPIFAQVSAFWQWPALLSASDEFVVKRGVNADGTVNNDLYIRRGYGACVRTSLNEFKQFFRHELPEDRYVNISDVAISKLQDGEWTDNDYRNCPPAPLEVKPTWRGSRPVYAMSWDEVNHMGTRLGKTPYRAIDGVCLRYNARKDGELTNYWMLDMDTLVYKDGEPVKVETLGYVAAICEPSDVSVEDWRG